MDPAAPPSESDRDSRRLWTAAVFAFVALEGATLQVQGALVPELRDTFGTPEWQLGLIAPAGTVGFLVFVAAAGAVAGRLDTRRLLLFGVFGTGVAVVAMGTVPTFGVFLAALVIRGAFSGIGRGTDRPLLSHLYPARRGRLFGYYDMLWAVGATLGPLVVTAALWAGDWRLAYYALGVAFLPVVALIWWLPSPSVDGGGEDPLTLSRLGRIARDPTVLVMAAGLLCLTGVEGGLFTWLTTYAEGRVPEAFVTVSLSVLLAAYVPGRFLAGVASDRIGYVPLAFGLGTLCLASAAYTFLVASGLAILAGVFCIGLTVSGLYPTLLAYATERTPEHSAPINAIGLVVSSCGIAGVPAVMGIVVGGAGVAQAMRLLFVPLVGLIAVTVVAWVRVGRAGSAQSVGPVRE
jgi:fucose permease